MSGGFDELSEEACRDLLRRCAVQAIKDYEHAYKVHKSAWGKYVKIKGKAFRTKRDRQSFGHYKASMTETEAEMKEIEEWFRSPLGEEAAGVSGEMAVKMIRDRARQLGVNLEDKSIDEVLEGVTDDKEG